MPAASRSPAPSPRRAARSGCSARLPAAARCRSAAGATLFAADAVGSGLTAAFAAPTSGAGGTLELFGIAASFGATIAGFAPGDAIESPATRSKTAAWANGVLTLTDTAGTALPLALPDGGGQTYETGLFVPVPDGLGGTAVLLAPAAIAPPEGDVTYTVPAGAFQTFTAVAALGHIVVAGTLVANISQSTPFP